jgi:hypothetical protein
MAMFLCILKSDKYLRQESKCGGQYRVANIGRIDVKIHNCPGFQAGGACGMYVLGFSQKKNHACG